MTKIIRDILSKDNTQSPCVSLTETPPMSVPNLSSLNVLEYSSQKKQKSQNSYEELEETSPALLGPILNFFWAEQQVLN